MKNIEYENLVADSFAKKGSIPSAIQSRQSNSNVVAKVTKYNRQNSLNLFKTFQNNSLQVHENNHSKMSFHSPSNSEDIKNENNELKEKRKANPILVRGSTLINRELSQQVIQQQHKLKEISSEIKQSNAKQFSNNINKANNYKKNMEIENFETITKRPDFKNDLILNSEKSEVEEASIVEIDELEPTMNKSKGLYTYTATSSSQLKDPVFLLNRSLTNLNFSNMNNNGTNLNLNNQFKYNRSDSLVSEKSSKDISIRVKNNLNNRQIFKDLEFIYNERQVAKLQRQILIQTQNKFNINNSNSSINAINNNINDCLESNFTRPNLIDNGLINNGYKFFERSKTTLLLDSLQPRLEFFVTSYDDPNESSAGENNLDTNIECEDEIDKNVETNDLNDIKNNILWDNSITS